MRFEDLNWMDVEQSVRSENRVILVLGACEQHGYLSLLSDVKIPLALADAASTQTGVLVAPALPYGVSPYFLAYPGTISIRLGTYLAFVDDIVRSLYRSGYRRILVLNGHGGNQPARTSLTELVNELSDLRINWYSWWTSHSVEAVAVKHALKPFHAAWSEAFPFTRVTELPEGEKIPPAYQGILPAEEFRRVFGDGVFGGKYEAEPEVMQEVFTAALEDILHLLENWDH